MFVIFDERPTVVSGYVSCFEREGIAAAGVDIQEFGEWFDAIGDEDVAAIEGFLIGSGAGRQLIPAKIRMRSRAPLIGIIDGRALNEMLDLFASGADDVVAKPFHIREILARIGAIRRRQKPAEESIEVGGVRVFFDGRDPLVAGGVLPLPRRERRILEYLVLSRNVRVTKTQIFNRVYGIFNEGIHENVIESHISRLRKRLRQRLGYDPIDSQRYLGYRLVDPVSLSENSAALADSTSLVQGPDVPVEAGAVSGQESDDGYLRSYDHERGRHVCAS
jgi:DNA-binding response OmpR family regulator